MKMVVTAPHVASYPDPVRFIAGQRLTLGREDDEFPGWFWCGDESGRQGWVHRSCFRLDSQEGALASRDYSAMELSVKGGEKGGIRESLGGWVWLILEDGREGWLPAKVLALEPGLTDEISQDSFRFPPAGPPVADGG